MPTSPVTNPEIDAVFGDGPSAVERAAPAATMTAEWARLRTFLRRPTLSVNEQNGDPVLVLSRIYALDMLVMFALVSVAITLEVSGVDLPDNVFEDLSWTPGLVLLIIVGAPVFEELIFRAWLPGRASHLMLLSGGIAAFALVSYSQTATNPSNLTAAYGFGMILLALVAAVVLRKRPAPESYVRWFPVFFWLSSIAFALVHLSNYDPELATIALPLVLPQFVLGMLLGYVRVRIGLWAAMALHAAHNASLLALSGLLILLFG